MPVAGLVAGRQSVAHFAAHDFGAWTLRGRRTGAFVGRGELKRLDLGGRPEVDILYALLPEYWGTGVVTGLSAAAVKLGLGQFAVALGSAV